MNKSGLVPLFLTLTLVLILSSCANRKKVVYFSNLDVALAEEAQSQYKTLIRSSDLLTIVVSAFDLKAVQPFNLPIVGQESLTGAVVGGQQLQSYLVDPEGNIEFPVLGRLKVAGLTRTELTNVLESKIAAYVTDPIVNVRIRNYKVSVLGEVTRPGSFTIPDERITLLEALAQAGDMTIYGRRDNVLVIRETDGVKTHTYIDITKGDFINTPFYYLQQNDVVYVEPNKAQVSSANYNRNIPVFNSMGSILITLISVLTR